MVKSIVLFVLGAVTGFGIASVTVKKKCEEILEEEITSVKKAYADSNSKKKEEQAESSSDTKEKETYEELTEQYKADDEPNTDIYIIKSEEYGMMDDYDLTGLTWYASNEVLVNENDEVMDKDDIAVAVGDIDFVSHFGEYEEDEVCIRNETLKTDYQIVSVEEAYEE